MSWSIVGCLVTIQAADGKIASPGYGTAGYANFQTCTWLLTSGNGRSIVMEFDPTFGFEEGEDLVKVGTASRRHPTWLKAALKFSHTDPD